MEAILIDMLSGDRIKVHDTTDHPTSSYGQAVWVDDKGNSYCQVGYEKAAMYEIVNNLKLEEK